MNSEKWREYYGYICSDLGIDPEKDHQSALSLSAILGNKSELSLLEPFRNTDFYVIGNGPNLESAIDHMGEARNTIVADSALPIYMKKKGIPDIVVTDLDGDMNFLARANNRGSLMVIHAHGDNIQLIRDFAPYFVNHSIGTTQGEPLPNIFNFYGFTDGDRGAFLAHYLGAGKLTLVGFDFEKVGKKPGIDRERKMKKLKWARILLEELAAERNTSLEKGEFIHL